MNCDSIRGLLPLFVYDDLATAEGAAVARHLADCSVCQAEHAGLLQTRSALDAGSTPIVAVDALALLQAETRRQTIRLRRWRRAALTVGALAALLLLAVLLKVEVQPKDGRIVIAWASLPAAARQEPRPPEEPRPPIDNPGRDFSERLQLVQELTRALVAELDARDGATRGEIVRLNGQITQLQRVSAERWSEAERDVAALYAAIRHPNLGDKP